MGYEVEVLPQIEDEIDAGIAQKKSFKSFT
jgi:hypothetical protein